MIDYASSSALIPKAFRLNFQCTRYSSMSIPSRPPMYIALVRQEPSDRHFTIVLMFAHPNPTPPSPPSYKSPLAHQHPTQNHSPPNTPPHSNAPTTHRHRQ